QASTCPTAHSSTKWRPCWLMASLARWRPSAWSTTQERNSAVSRGLKPTIAILSVLVVFGLITLPSLRRAVQRIAATQRTEEQARRDVLQVPVSTPTDVRVKAQMYWLSTT